MKIAIFGSKRQELRRIERIFEFLMANDVQVYVQERFYRYLSDEFNLNYTISGLISNDDFEADLAISIGGDGTFLRTAASIGKKDIPILGINTGRLGFLADITDKDIDQALSDMLAGRYRVELRSRLHLTTQEKSFQGLNYALNEVAILKQDTASMITVNAYINDEFLSTYEADGLIIATPTGSTAYSLSVGGPIMSPTASGFILTAVAPHSLSSRPLIVDDNCTITLDICSRSDNYLVSLDGRSEILPVGTRLIITKAEAPLRLVKRVGHTFYGTLRDKLKWGIDPRQK